MTLRMIALVFCAALLVSAGSVFADTLVITFDTAPAAPLCGETWVESGAILSFVPTTAGDCSEGDCFFDVSPGEVWLFPSRLNVDLSAICGVISAEIDIIDNCGAGCTNAFFYEGAVTVDSAANSVANAETLILSAGASIVDRLAVSSCEGACLEIRIEYDAGASSTESGSWGSIKALFE